MNSFRIFLWLYILYIYAYTYIYTGYCSFDGHFDHSPAKHIFKRTVRCLLVFIVVVVVVGVIPGGEASASRYRERSVVFVCNASMNSICIYLQQKDI